MSTRPDAITNGSRSGIDSGETVTSTIVISPVCIGQFYRPRAKDAPGTLFADVTSSLAAPFIRAGTWTQAASEPEKGPIMRTSLSKKLASFRWLVTGVAVGALGCTGIIGTSPSQGRTSGSGTGATSGSGSGTGSTGIGNGSSGTGNSGVGATGTGATGAVSGPPTTAFAPAPGAFRRLTATSFQNSLNDLLGGPVTIGDLEPDSWEVGGFATVSAGTVSISELGVEQYQTAVDAATTQAFADTTRRNKLLGCTPKSTTDTACFQSFVTAFGRLAFRQPLTAAQVTRYATVASTVAASAKDPYEGMRAAANAILLSPNFLYRTEKGAPASGTAFWQYTSSEMAGRLSYFLTNSTPDATLMSLVDSNGLQTASAVRAQADRLLSTPAGRQSVGNFAAEMFQLQVITGRGKDPTLYPQYNAALQWGMMQEIPLMLAALVFDQKASALTMFTTPNTFVNKDLAALYGLPTTGLSSTAMAAATLPSSGLRAGLLGTAAYLSINGSQKEGSPTLRGKFIREILLCQDIPPPPANVNTMLMDPPAGQVLTKRQRLLEQHESVATCAACHALMDPLGLTLENFDAIGGYRQTDQGQPIDVTGTLDKTDFNGPLELGQLLSQKPAVASCLVRSLYRYGTGHVETDAEATVLYDLGQKFVASGYQLRDLMLDLVSSDGFRYVAATTP